LTKHKPKGNEEKKKKKRKKKREAKTGSAVEKKTREKDTLPP
jgi:hypothetical protein